MNSRLDIILRTCDVKNVHAGNRVVDVDKKEIIKRCLRSLVNSINLVPSNVRENILLTIFDDHSSTICLDDIKQELLYCECNSKVINLTDSGNTASIKACFEYARDYGREIIYFVEDDYLHFPSAISEMLQAYENFSKNLGGREVALFPVDYPDRYFSNNLYSSRIVLGNERHWRTVVHSTLTFMVSRNVIVKNWPVYEKIWQTNSNFVNEDDTVNKIWQSEAFLFSPIPSLAIHMQSKENIPPFLDWQKLWNSVDFR